MPRQTNGQTLDDVLHSMRSIPIPEDSLQAALDRAARIETSNDVDGDADFNEGTLRHWSQSRRMLLRIAVLFLIGVSFYGGTWLFGGQPGLARAELVQALEHLDSVHLVIKSTGDGDDDDVEVWFKRGAGFAMHSPFGVEIDDGRKSLVFYRSQNMAIRSTSQLKESRFANVQMLGKAMGFHIDDLPQRLPRLDKADVSIDGWACQAYVLTQDDFDVPQPTSGEIPEELWPHRRTVFFVDANNRLRRCENQRGLGDQWESYRTIAISYETSIPESRFIADLPEDVRIVEANESGLEIEADVAALAAGVEKRHAAYCDLTFTYNAVAEIKASPESHFARGESGNFETVETLSLLQPTSDAPDRLRRRWTQRLRRDSSGDGPLRRFASFDGKVSHLARVGFQSLIVPGEAWDTFSENEFDKFLFLRINGQSDTVPAPPGVRDLFLNRYHVVDRRQSGGRELVTLHGSSTAEFGVEYRVEMTAEPEFMILRWEARYARRKNQLLNLYIVTELGKIDGMSYPARGYFRQMPIREAKDVKYHFRITKVEPLAKDIRDNWRPKWPSGANVRDLTKNHNPK